LLASAWDQAALGHVSWPPRSSAALLPSFRDGIGSTFSASVRSQVLLMQ